MHTNTGSAQVDTATVTPSATSPAAVLSGPPPTPGPPAGSDELAVFLATVAEAERLQAQAVALAGRLSSSGASERAHGLPLDLLLAADVGMTGADRHMLITAGQVLDTMPHLAQAHRDGRLSWSQVRHVVIAVRRRGLEDRAVIDGRIAETLACAGDHAVDPDGFVAAIDAAVDELISRRALEDREKRAEAANRLWAQPGFDGRVHGGFDYDAVSGGVVLNALAASQGRPAADDPDREPEDPTAQQRSAAAALVAVCQAFLAGGSGGHATPSYVIDVNASDLDASQPGRLRLRLPGAPRRVTARRIAADATAGADVRVVITDGAAPLAVSRPVRTDAAVLDTDTAAEQVRPLAIPRPAKPGIAALIAAVNRALTHPEIALAAAGERPLCDRARLDAEDIPAATRIAVTARDKGCRFYGCTAPADWCDLHHTIHQARGGDHHPDRLVLLCRTHHTLTHDHGWNLTLAPATGVLIGRRGTRTWRTQPRGSPLAPPAERGPPHRADTGDNADAGHTHDAKPLPF